MNKASKIYIAGHLGMVGRALVKAFTQAGYTNLILRGRDELDLLDQAAVNHFFKSEQPDCIIVAAAKVGGIWANNTYRADFLIENLLIEANLIKAAHDYNAEKLLFLGSSCIYPALAPQPLKEDYLLTGPLETTNEPYAIAKIAGLKLCEAYKDQYGDNFVSIMPTNLYGPHDNFSLKESHVLPALMRKMHDAKTAGHASVEIWGTGSALREFLYVDDLADACLFLMQGNYEPKWMNVGSGQEVTIKELALAVQKTVGFKGQLQFNTSYPDGTPRKFLDSSRLLSLGWQPKIGLERGLNMTYKWFLENQHNFRA
jgi:GDP-L-fucose synthase